MARPCHEPTDHMRRQVRGMSGLAVPQEDIARMMEIHIETLLKYYAADLAAGRAEANLKVARAMFKAATRETNPNVVAGMFWLKNRGGWKDIGANTTTVIVPGIDAPPRPETWEEWNARRRAELAQVVAAAGTAATRH